MKTDTHAQLVAALRSAVAEIEQLCSTVNTCAVKAGLGRKVHPEDWGCKAREVLASLKEAST
jgi:hypothetical protein